jgi:hypothetical protein
VGWEQSRGTRDSAARLSACLNGVSGQISDLSHVRRNLLNVNRFCYSMPQPDNVAQKRFIALRLLCAVSYCGQKACVAGRRGFFRNVYEIRWIPDVFFISAHSSKI